MQIKTAAPALLAAASGLLTFVAVCQLNFIAGCFCYVPLFVAIQKRSVKSVMMLACIFALFFSMPAFAWMIPAADRFTGNSPIYGIGVFLLCTIFYIVYSALYLGLFAWLKNKTAAINLLLHSLLAASVFCLAEWLLTFVSSGLPWFDVHSGNAFIKNIYAIQPAAFFGTHIIGFTVVAINYLIALAIVNKLWKQLLIPAISLPGYLLLGFLLLQNFNRELPTGAAFDLAIVAGNVAPEVKWDETNGNALVKQLLDLNRQAATSKPQILLWSESAIPWTYSKEDDLLKAILEITDPEQITHVLGMNTAFAENEVFNSVYGISPGGAITGRYDKQHLLSFVEKPLGGVVIPFLSSGGFTARSNPAHAAPIRTAKGKAGILICNEAALSQAAASQARQGAQFLLNLSNDGWFSESYIKDIHFYYARMRAVETRKDIAVNSNYGYSGLIAASGEIRAQMGDPTSFIKVVEVRPNDIATVATRYPLLFLYGCLLVVGVLLLFSRYRNSKALK